MDSYGEIDEESGNQDQVPVETAGTLMGAKMAELGKLKDKLTKSKDEAVQSWLDSKPLIDELEMIKSALADAKSRTALSNAAIPELESQLETFTTTIRVKKEEELKIRTMSNTINQALQRTQSEMEQIKMERDEKHRARLKIKQALRLRRQTLRTLQLTLRAVRLESEAYGASAAEANRYINHSQMDDTMVKLNQEEYHALAKKARDETSLAEWRIGVSMEQKQIAKGSKDSAAKRLKNMQSVSGSMNREHKAGGLDNHIEPTAEELHPNVRARSYARERRNGLPKTKAIPPSESSQRKLKEQLGKSKSEKNHLSKRTKLSCFTRIRVLLVQKIKKYF